MSLSSQQLWANVLKELENSLNKQSYETWFKPTRSLSYSENKLVIEVPSRFFCDWLNEHYLSILIENWWQERYKDLETYSVYPWLGEQCTTTVRISLEKANVIPFSATQTPKDFLYFLKTYAKHHADMIAGKPAKGKRATITQIQWEKKP